MFVAGASQLKVALPVAALAGTVGLVGSLDPVDTGTELLPDPLPLLLAGAATGESIGAESDPQPVSAEVKNRSVVNEARVAVRRCICMLA